MISGPGTGKTAARTGRPEDWSHRHLIYLSGATSGDSNSAPFVDYGHDILWVGEDTGSLHEVTGVFTGTGSPNCGSGDTCAVQVSQVKLQ